MLSNGTLTIELDYSFTTNHAQRLLAVQPYSNEIAQAFAFLESLSPTNLQAMSVNDIVGLYLWKESSPGESPIPEEEIPFVAQNMRSMRYFSPPSFAFHVWEVGPTNNPPYLWCEVPSQNSRGKPSHSAMIYFQNKWWLTEWPLEPGEQQW